MRNEVAAAPHHRYCSGGAPRPVHGRAPHRLSGERASGGAARSAQCLLLSPRTCFGPISGGSAWGDEKVGPSGTEPPPSDAEGARVSRLDVQWQVPSISMGRARRPSGRAAMCRRGRSRMCKVWLQSTKRSGTELSRGRRVAGGLLRACDMSLCARERVLAVGEAGGPGKRAFTRRLQNT